MLFSTPGQFAVLALVLVAGWFLGLASHSGGRRWRERYAAERDAHAAYRKDADNRVAEAHRHADARVAEVEERRAELERENARLTRGAPEARTTVPPTTATTAAPPVTAQDAATPAYPTRTVYTASEDNA